ncbi:hypothetical protein C4F49_05050 [Sphingobacterium sp. KB22]|uniref:Two component regulator propeller n=2 Tax=Sphingobacterium hungaricum TaxID=2082723 RepID=A0A928YPL4_9SPHI|nr:hypothetical protein [Sphingobacterium hungaricum]
MQFTVNDGLPSNEIVSMEIDKRGLLWITTGRGLCVFDGTRFKLINPGNDILARNLTSIAIDDENKLWMTSANRGLFSYDPKKPFSQAFEHIQLHLSKKNLTKNELYKAFHASDKQIYFGGQDTGLQSIDPLTGKISQINLSENVINNSIYSFTEDGNRNLYIGTRHHGLFKYNLDRETSENIPLNLAIKRSPAEHAVTSLFYQNQHLFVGYYDIGLIQYALKQKSENLLIDLGINHSAYANTFTSIATWPEKPNDIIASHVKDGLYVISGNRVTLIPWSKITPNDTSETKITQLLKTSNGLWIATEGKGLLFYNASLNKISDFYPLKKTEEPILKIIQAEGNFYYLTASEFGKFKLTDKKRTRLCSVSDLPISKIWAIEKSIYISTYDRGVYEFSFSANQFQELPIIGEAHGFRSADCNSIIKDTINNLPVLWIGSWNSGIYKYHLDTKRIELFATKNGLPDHKVINLGKDKHKTIWVATDGFGLLQIVDKENFAYKHHWHSKSQNSIPSNTPFNFLLDTKGRFWMTSASSGLTEIALKNGNYVFEQTKDQNASPWLYTHQFYELNDGSLFMQSADGFMIFCPKTEKFIQLNVAKGLVPSPYYKSITTFHFSDSFLWLTNKGLIEGKASSFAKVDEKISRPIISSFKIQNEDASHLLFTKELVLSPEENNFSFTFSDKPGETLTIKHAYFLEGFDKNWIESDEELSAFYSNLPGGKYTFKVRNGDVYGNWNEDIAQVSIYLKTHWYLTWWFRTLMVLLIIFVLIAVFTYRLQQQKKVNQLQRTFNIRLAKELKEQTKLVEEQMKTLERERQENLLLEMRQKLSESELKAVRSQMNPHFIFNVLNSIESYVVENDSKKASHLIQQFSRLSRLVLENSMVGFVDLKSELLLNTLYLELEQERFENSFSFEIDVASDINQETQQIPSMLIQPLIENAIHHGIRHLKDKHGLVSIRIFRENQFIVVEIADNGVGFSNEMESSFKNTSFGIKGVIDRLNIVNSEKINAEEFLHILHNGENYTTKIIIRLAS